MSAPPVISAFMLDKPVSSLHSNSSEYTHKRVYPPAFLVAQMVKKLPAMQETQVQSLGQEDALEKEIATHSSILAWKTPWTEGPGGSQRVRHEQLTHTHTHTHNVHECTHPGPLQSHIVWHKIYVHIWKHTWKDFSKLGYQRHFFLLLKTKSLLSSGKKITQGVEITLNEISLTFTEIHELRSSKDHRRKHKCRVLNSTWNRKWSEGTRPSRCNSENTGV